MVSCGVIIIAKCKCSIKKNKLDYPLKTFVSNLGEGFDIMLPYVWQYNENFTHTVHMVSYSVLIILKYLSFNIELTKQTIFLVLQDSNYMAHNRHFGLVLRGHSACVYIVNKTIKMFHFTNENKYSLTHKMTSLSLAVQ